MIIVLTSLTGLAPWEFEFLIPRLQEPDTTEPPVEIPPNWPTNGSVSFNNFAMRYRPGLPLVIMNTSFSVNAGEKVGIVGRTGSGKSSLLSAMFRLVEGAEGCIKVDGLNIAAVPLRVLRKSLAIIPQVSSPLLTTLESS